jgi:hypothetical protein
MMGQFCSPYHLAACVVDQRQASHLRTRIDFEPQRNWHRSLNDVPQNKSEGVGPIDSGFPVGQQDACSRRTDRTQRLLIGIEDKNLTHSGFSAVCPCGPLVSQVK